MKKRLYHLFIWIAGSDPEILEKCSRSEQIKHACFGGLILIPTTFAFLSMPYTISTLGVAWEYCLAVGVIWAAIIFIIDRTMVSSFRKRDNVWKDISSIAFILRVVFAIGLGIVVSDPLVLKLFEGRIDEAIVLREERIKKNLNEKFDKQITIEEDKIDLFQQKYVEPVRAMRDFYTRLTGYEKAGLDTVIISPKGESFEISRYRSFGEQARLYRQRSDEEQVELTRLFAQHDSLRKSVTENTSRIELRRDSALAKLQENLGSDYLTRSEVLDELAESSPSVYKRRWFWFAFLVLVDTVAVLFKALLPANEYDLILYEYSKGKIDTSHYFHKVNSGQKRLLIDHVGEFQRREITRILAEGDQDNRTLSERLTELERLTNLKWGS